MELIVRVYPASIEYFGTQDFTIGAGQVLKIETSPDGEEILTAQVPVGKQWDVTVMVKVREE